MVRCTAAVFALAALGLVNADIVEYKVRVRNLTYMQPFSPPFIIVHTKDVSGFREGQPASDAIKLVAEDGDVSGIIALGSDPSVAPFLCGGVLADGPLLPGETFRGTMEVDTEICGDRPVFSMAAMLVNTNDAFVGIDSEDLVFYGASKSFPPAFDAGTEMNNELCTHMPGPACKADSGNKEATPGEGYVHVHRGVHGIGDIAESVYDWRNPVAEVFIQAIY